MITRFAPSPTGYLHLGHAYAAIFAARGAERFILRLEDIDQTRSRLEFEQAIDEDLHWLGLDWPQPVRRQSEHFSDYTKALDSLSEQDLVYPCFCTRKDIQSSTNAPHGPEGVLYPGSCKKLTRSEREDKIQSGQPYALRLDVSKASGQAGDLDWFDHEKGRQRATPEILGDVVLARKDTPASYHLCVTLDDHVQGITKVTRGEDLFYATHLHRLLQALLDLNVPEWHHHRLILDENGQRFAKRNQSVTLRFLREEEKWTAQQVIDRIGLSL